MPPDEILAAFREKWVGTEEELETALELFYNDIRDSLVTEGVPKETLTVVDDYVGNHYF